uniref:Uncharacterized protein n=1 Tax=Desmodus rotundus TaxID=9430 RepID=K9IGK4_DESRO
MNFFLSDLIVVFSFLVFCSSAWQVFTSSVFIVWRLSCSEIASSNLCSKDLAFSLAEWAVPSRSSTWRCTVNTGFSQCGQERKQLSAHCYAQETANVLFFSGK